MKKLLTLISMIAILALLAAPAMAKDYDNTLYGQEGTEKDGYGAIDASDQGPEGDETDNYTNWSHQTGNASWAGIYSWDGDAWLTVTDEGDSSIEVEADIEMFWSETIENNKIYFHIGNPFTATTLDKTAVVKATYATNHPMYVGISFAGTTKEEDDFETDGSGALTGRIIDGMVGIDDIAGRDITSESFDIVFKLRMNGGGWLAPTSFGEGSHNTQEKVLWWDPDVTNMTLGTGSFDYLVQIEPQAGQADGKYELDPATVTAPVL